MISHPPSLQVSKWLQIQVLIETSEMESLLNTLEVDHFFLMGRLCHPGEECVPRQAFLNVYADYISSLKKGVIPEEASFRPFFSSALSVTNQVFYTQIVNDGRCILRPIRPVVQCQVHRISYSATDGKFRSMAMGSNSMEWGIQFSYPQLFQDPLTQEICPIKECPDFPNTALFKTLQKWVREYTLPTPFYVKGKKKPVPMRLGKECLSWINQHPQLLQQQIKVVIP
jgi:hypothetical protein